MSESEPKKNMDWQIERSLWLPLPSIAMYILFDKNPHVFFKV